MKRSGIWGFDVRTEILSYDVVLTSVEWKQLKENLKKEFEEHRQELRNVRDQFEHWPLFGTPSLSP